MGIVILILEVYLLYICVVGILIAPVLMFILVWGLIKLLTTE